MIKIIAKNKLYNITGSNLTQDELNTPKPFKPIFADMHGSLTAKKAGQSMQGWIGRCLDL